MNHYFCCFSFSFVSVFHSVYDKSSFDHFETAGIEWSKGNTRRNDNDSCFIIHSSSQRKFISHRKFKTKKIHASSTLHSLTILNGFLSSNYPIVSQVFFSLFRCRLRHKFFSLNFSPICMKKDFGKCLIRHIQNNHWIFNSNFILSI